MVRASSEQAPYTVTELHYVPLLCVELLSVDVVTASQGLTLI